MAVFTTYETLNTRVIVLLNWTSSLIQTYLLTFWKNDYDY